jgi:hypothetical protein
MIPLTQMKLREAAFFFGLLDETRQRIVNNEPETYAFYLSAFLSAARAVTFTLKFEEKPNYNTWFPPWLASRTENESKLLDFMRDQRNYSQKRGSAEFTSSDNPDDWEWIPITEVKTDAQRSHPAYGFHWFDSPWISPGSKVGRRPYYFKEYVGDQNEVTSVCKQYLDILAKLVNDFVSWRQGQLGSDTMA